MFTRVGDAANQQQNRTSHSERLLGSFTVCFFFTNRIPEDAEGNIFTLFVSSQGGRGVGMEVPTPTPSASLPPAQSHGMGVELINL